MITLDFETKGIDGDPIVTPPEPVGVSIKVDQGPSEYYTGEDMVRECRKIWSGTAPMLFHNAPFDLRVAEDHLGLPMPHWSRIHDTKFLLYLQDPHAQSLSLKPSGARLLNRDPHEQDEVREWILLNVEEAKPSTWGAFIWRAPLELVAKYAKQDTDLTRQLYDYVLPLVPMEPYNLERELMPHLVRATRKGIRLDRARLYQDLSSAELMLSVAESRIHTALGEFDISKGAQLADALDRAGKVTEWKLTKTGKRSTARDNLMAVVNDPELLALLSYHGGLKTCLQTFMRPWLQLSEKSGRLHPSWNQIRDDNYGTRTGRLSCSTPNLQNVPKPFELEIPEGLARIPNMRDYLLPESGQQWVSRDYDGQEMRLLAHYEDGALQSGFITNPGMDPHEMVKNLIAENTGVLYSRGQVKGVGFGIIYGMGGSGLAKQLKIDVGDAYALIDAYHEALPGVGLVQRVTKKRGRTGIPIHTIGGRVYYCEPKKMDKDGCVRSFEYKLLNYLIQGSAADQTKRALLDYFNSKPEDEEFLCTVHDEINISQPMGNTGEALRASMEEPRMGVTVPMTTSLSIGPRWGQLKEQAQ